MYFVSPSAGEHFYLRTLLTVAKGTTFFENLHTMDGVLCPTFKDACVARGLWKDDQEWKQCFQEAADMQTGSQLHTLFATILDQCWLAAPHELWDQFKERICDDLGHRISQLYPSDPPPSPELIYDYGLFLVDQQLMRSGKRLSDHPPMPQHSLRDWGQAAPNFLLHEQLNYDQAQLAATIQTNLGTFNPEQRAAFDAVMQSHDQNLGKTFLDSAGGGGKTWICNTIATAVHSSQHQDCRVAFCVASSDIATHLLLAAIPPIHTSRSLLKSMKTPCAI
jgi:hypothetical protein